MVYMWCKAQLQHHNRVVRVRSKLRTVTKQISEDSDCFSYQGHEDGAHSISRTAHQVERHDVANFQRHQSIDILCEAGNDTPASHVSSSNTQRLYYCFSTQYWRTIWSQETMTSSLRYKTTHKYPHNSRKCSRRFQRHRSITDSRHTNHQTEDIIKELTGAPGVIEWVDELELIYRLTNNTCLDFDIIEALW